MLVFIANGEFSAKYLGGASKAGGKLKTTGTIEGGNGVWASPNLGATNESRFSALPGGHRVGSGAFEFPNPGLFGNWWTSTSLVSTDAMQANRCMDAGLVF